MELTENKKISTHRIEWIDVAKGLGMLLVVIGHCNPPGWIKAGIFAFHMPLFFVLSGFTYRRKNNTTVQWKKDFQRLIVPYLVTVCAVGVSLLIIMAEGRKGYYDSFSEFCKAALYGYGSDYQNIKIIGELWFLLTLFWSRRVMDTLFLCDNRRIRLLLVSAFVGAGIALASSSRWVPTNIDIAFVAVGFMYMGWVVGQRPELIDDKAFLCVCFMISIAALCTSRFGMSDRNYYMQWYVSIPGAFALSLLACRASKEISKSRILSPFFSFVGRNSLLLLCVHSLDWRMPFPRFGLFLISPFAGKSWYWILDSIHRFFFDIIVVCFLLLLKKLFHMAVSRRREY